VGSWLQSQQCLSRIVREALGRGLLGVARSEQQHPRYPRLTLQFENIRRKTTLSLEELRYLPGPALDHVCRQIPTAVDRVADRVPLLRSAPVRILRPRLQNSRDNIGTPVS
jgi:hypothetical protein